MLEGGNREVLNIWHTVHEQWRLSVLSEYRTTEYAADKVGTLDLNHTVISYTLWMFHSRPYAALLFTRAGDTFRHTHTFCGAQWVVLPLCLSVSLSSYYLQTLQASSVCLSPAWRETILSGLLLPASLQHWDPACISAALGRSLHLCSTGMQPASLQHWDAACIYGTLFENYFGTCYKNCSDIQKRYSEKKNILSYTIHFMVTEALRNSFVLVAMVICFKECML